MMNYTSKKSKRESWRRETIYNGEGQVDVQSTDSSLL
jgi:hypothetical protein